MEHLVFQLQAPLSSWGEPAVGEFRGTGEMPTQSAVIGLLGAALGLDRFDEAAHAALRDGYGIAVALLSSGSLLRDYHTAQVPPHAKLKGRPHATRRHELSVPKDDLGTILSTRDYRQNAASLVALQPRSGVTAPHELGALAEALRLPKFTLYLGRKSCAPAAPLWPQVIEAESAWAAFQQYTDRFEGAREKAATEMGKVPPLEPLSRIGKIAFDDHVIAGLASDLTVRRKDRLIRRQGWQFGDRIEHIALIPDTLAVTPAKD
ncbi:type I-E CRISPR-associated protein Cas5/CasD [Hydrogenophaga sp. NFH-34]|uniref:type I-E CRISPR-associated protein Cas5/CasD n=1 Tax=Hydrogenophaga sp. NFH-34 TaxID=2744446 RepID=UPI001F1587FA|nr:type I-E CRISPR-associated protein Cas5/CasD [Hydrogenophaga sp. NFH-34]